MDSYQNIVLGSKYRMVDINIHRKKMNQIQERKNEFLFENNDNQFPKRNKIKNATTEYSKIIIILIVRK